MIRSDRGAILLQGDHRQLLAELSTCIMALHDSLSKRMPEDEAREKLMLAVERAFMTPAEIAAAGAEARSELICKAKDGNVDAANALAFIRDEIDAALRKEDGAADE